jgi:hypothetical protein
MTDSARPAAAGWRRVVGAAALAAILLALVAVSWAANFARREALPAMPLSSLVASARIAEHRFALATSTQPLPRQELVRIVEGLAKFPLAAEPFLAVVRLEPNSPRNQDRLERALSRNPRSTLTRIVALQEALASQDIKRAVAMLAQLNALNQELMLPLIQAFTASVERPDQLDEIVAAMVEHPALMQRFAEGYLRSNPPRELLLRLVQTAPKGTLAEPGLRDLTVGRLIEADRIDEALALAGGPTPRGALVNNPTFEGPRQTSPFGWRLLDSEVGASEFTREGLAVEFYGRHSGSLVEQVVALRPARDYRARIEYTGSGRGGGHLRLVVRCAASGKVLAQQPLQHKSGRNAASMQFRVPADGCRGQVLAIAAQRDDSFSRDSIEIRRLELDAA